MGLLTNVFQRRPSSTPASSVPAPDAVALARARARRRLIGATVLLLVGLVAFPMLFETRPRPVSGDIAFEMARQDTSPQARSAPPPLAPAPAVVADPVPAVDSEPPPRPAVAAATPQTAAPREIVEQDDGREREVAAAPSHEPRPAPDDAAARTAAAEHVAAVKAAADKLRQDKERADRERAERTARAEKAEKSDKADRSDKGDHAASAPAQRIVVQVGAFTDPDKLREARRKVESLGLKTYTQVIEVDGVARTRVRVGPFATRAEADKAAARLKDAGLATAMLQL